MSDETVKTINMPEPIKDVETTKVEESTKVETETKDDVDTNKDTDTGIDYDAEIAEEKKKGKPDPEIAKKAFLDRQAKREAGEEGESEDDKPLTRKDIAEVESRLEKKHLNTQALAIATQFAGSVKEAELIVEKWKNRTFPQGLSLNDQIEESFAITHRKRIIGERNEALRALKGRSGVNDNPAGAHHDSQKGGGPEIAGIDKAAILASGFKYNETNRRFEKKLKNGDTLIQDPKTKQTSIVKKS